MGIAVSFQHFSVDPRKLGLSRSNETAWPPIVTTRQVTQGQRPDVPQTRPGSHPSSTAPQYLTAAHQQPAATEETNQAKVLPYTLTAHDRSPDTQADRKQYPVSLPNKAVSANPEARASGQGSKSSKVSCLQPANRISQLDHQISMAIQAGNKAVLTKLLDAHPHAGPDSADKSFGTFIRNCFREVASWFNSAAFAWQGEQAVALLNEAARVGDAGVVQILLDRGMDLAKDKPMLEPALWTAVTSGNAEATGLLLREVILVDPGYVKNVELTTKAASEGHAKVLEVLVEQGMALPKENSWPRFGKAIAGFLRWEAAARRPAGERKTLSFTAQRDIKDKLDGLKPQFGWQLNGMRCSLNEAQKRWRLAAMYAGPGLLGVEEQAYTEAGFTVGTAKKLVEEFDSNADRYIFRRAKSASATLARVVADELANITSTGKIRPDLLKHLIDQGMYGLVADMVVDAARSAVASPLWKAAANRKVLFLKALDQSAGARTEVVPQARAASGDPGLFDKLLNPQLELLVAYCESRHDQEPVASTRKRRASI